MKEKQVPIWQFNNELQGILLIGFSLVIFKLYVSKKNLDYTGTQDDSFFVVCNDKPFYHRFFPSFEQRFKWGRL